MMPSSRKRRARKRRAALNALKTNQEPEIPYNQDPSSSSLSSYPSRKLPLPLDFEPSRFSREGEAKPTGTPQRVEQIAPYPQQARVNIAAALQQQIGIRSSAVTQVPNQQASQANIEVEREEKTMENVPHYSSVDSPQSDAIGPISKHAIPPFRPHLGSRREYEKQYGLAPGESYTMRNMSGIGKNQGAQMQQGSSPFREITNEALHSRNREQLTQRPSRSLAPEERKRGLQEPTRTYVYPVIKEEESSIKDEDTSDIYNDSGNEQPSLTQVTPAIKSEGTHDEDEVTPSPEVTFILSHKDKPHTPLAPPTTPGLATSRYAYGAHQSSQIQPSKTQAEAAGKPNANVQQKVRQALADPLDFMSAAGRVSANKRSAQLQPRSLAEPKRVPPMSAEAPTAEPTLKEDKRYDEATFVGAGPSKTTPGPRFQSDTAGWPKFPSARDGEDQEPVAPGTTNPRTVDSTPTKRPLPNTTPANQAEATLVWQQGKKNNVAIESVKFAPIGWSPSPSPPEARCPAAKVPALVQSSQYFHYTDHVTIEQGVSTALVPIPSSQVQSPVENVDANNDYVNTLSVQLVEQGDRLETLEQEVEDYKKERDVLDQEIAMLKAQVDDAKNIRTQYTLLKAEYDGMKNTLEAPSTGATLTTGQLTWLTQRNRELELENKSKEPLFRIGRDVRARFLEEARFTVLHIERSELDKSLLERGHVASRNAVGDADRALSIGGFLTNAQIKNLKPTFRTLYGEYPDEYYGLSAKMRVAMDVLATCQTSPALNSNHPKIPRAELQEIEALVRMMAKKHWEMGAKYFEEDIDGHAARHLARVKELMVPVTLFERKWCRQAVKEKIENHRSTGNNPEK